MDEFPDIIKPHLTTVYRAGLVNVCESVGSSRNFHDKVLGELSIDGDLAMLRMSIAIYWLMILLALCLDVKNANPESHMS